MPQLDFSTFAAQIFWLVLTFGVLYWILSRHSLPVIREVLQNRQIRIASDIKKAELLKEEAEDAEADFESVLAEARQKAALMIESVKHKADENERIRFAQLDESFAKELAESEKRVEKVQKEAFAKLAPELSKVVSSAVKKVIHIDIDAKNAEAIIQRANQ